MPESDKFHFQERRTTLRQFREQLGLSASEVSRRSGLCRSMIGKFERGERDLSPNALNRLEETIAYALGSAKAAALERGRQMDALAEELLPKGLAPLSSLAYPMEWERAVTGWRERHGDAANELGQILWIAAAAENADLRRRVAELRDLLGLETAAALAKSRAKELRERVKE